MVELTLPRNSKVTQGKVWPKPEGATRLREYRVYRYDPDEANGFAAGQTYLPDCLHERRFYEPGDAGMEREIAERLAAWRARRSAKGGRPSSSGTST